MNTIEQHDLERLRLIRAVHRLGRNEDFLLIRRKLFAMAPPLERPAFSAADGFSACAAAQRDGASSLTRYLLNLTLSDPAPEATGRDGAAAADFVGA